MAEFDFTQLGFEIGGAGAIGFLIGFAAKKVAKVIAIIIGIQLVIFKFLESRGILQVDWNRLTAGMVKATEVGAGGAPPSWMNTILSTLSVSAGFTGGFLLGFRRG